jgi:hypothetical protein
MAPLPIGGLARTRNGLLVDDELARAVRTEAAAAVAYWWGVGPTAVARWRKALGVTRSNNAGTVRLRLEVAKRAGDAAKSHEYTDAERAVRRRNALRLNLGRHLRRDTNGRQWTPAEDAMLGTLPDDEVAKRIGRKPSAVRVRRAKLGIPSAYDRRRAR